MTEAQRISIVILIYCRKNNKLYLSLLCLFAQALQGEVSQLTQSLESSLLEKGEIASRLNSTQDEVQQMRTGIEKLQVRIESDERKKKKMGDLLKGDLLTMSLRIQFCKNVVVPI